jgi:hypothetical protein
MLDDYREFWWIGIKGVLGCPEFTLLTPAINRYDGQSNIFTINTG